MAGSKSIILILLIVMSGTLACSISGASQRARTLKQTSQAVRTDVSSLISSGSSLIKTAQAIATERPGILETVISLRTQGAPLLSAIQAAETNNPGIVQTAKALMDNQMPTGEPAADIPILDKQSATNFVGSSQYIIYNTPVEYQQALDFYKTEMPNNGWVFMDGDSHEYARAAQLHYYKDTRRATVNLSLNPLNNTTVIMINILNE